MQGPGDQPETIGNHWRSRKNECVNFRDDPAAAGAADEVVTTRQSASYGEGELLR
jgi:hypothetical protein